MRQIVDQSLAVGFIPINTRLQRASLPFKPGVFERKLYNNEDKKNILFRINVCQDLRFRLQHIITLGLGKPYKTEKNVLSSY